VVLVVLVLAAAAAFAAYRVKFRRDQEKQLPEPKAAAPSAGAVAGGLDATAVLSRALD